MVLPANMHRTTNHSTATKKRKKNAARTAVNTWNGTRLACGIVVAQPRPCTWKFATAATAFRNEMSGSGKEKGKSSKMLLSWR